MRGVILRCALFLARLEGWAASTVVASILRGSPRRRAPQDDGSIASHPFRMTSGVRLRPGARGLGLFLVSVDRGLLFHGEADVVEAVHQAVLAERVDLEFHRAAIRST